MSVTPVRCLGTSGTCPRATWYVAQRIPLKRCAVGSYVLRPTRRWALTVRRRHLARDLGARAETQLVETRSALSRRRQERLLTIGVRRPSRLDRRGAASHARRSVLPGGPTDARLHSSCPERGGPRVDRTTDQ